MHILIAPDSFKESLTASEVAQSIRDGLASRLPEATFDLMPLGDGGEGTVDAIASHLGLFEEKMEVTGPFGKPLIASYATDGKLAIFEMASICGLELVPQNQRSPLDLTTFGVGEMIRKLVVKGIRQLMIGVGGSSTNDGGIGMAQALGYRFLDANGNTLPATGRHLGQVARIDDSGLLQDLSQLSISIITDVTNPLCGKQGATYVFGAQKGLALGQFTTVDAAMSSFYQLVNPTMLAINGAGAGGGMAAGLMTFANGKLLSGIDAVLDKLDFDERVKKADLVIVGEGKMDFQSLSGKAPVGVARRVPKGIPVIAICGSLSDDLPAFPQAGISAAFPIISQVASLDETLKQAQANLVRTAQNIANLINLRLK